MSDIKRLWIAAGFIAGVLITLIFSSWLVEAQPPHPRTHYKWEAWPNGTVVLYYLNEGQYTRYVYQMTQKIMPATDCTHSYDQDTFRLITFDSSHPYFYTLRMAPTMIWEPNSKKYIKIE